jgi:hypothetical protein
MNASQLDKNARDSHSSHLLAMVNYKTSAALLALTSPTSRATISQVPSRARPNAGSQAHSAHPGAILTYRRRLCEASEPILSLYPMKFEDAVKVIAKAKPEPRVKGKPKY